MASRPVGRALLVILFVALVVSWMFTLGIERDRKRLAAANREAEAAVSALEEERVGLALELDQVRQNLEGKDSELQALRTELAGLQSQLADAQHEITRLHEENTLALDSHARMHEQFAAIFIEKQQLEARLSSIKELKLAIRSVKRRLHEERWQSYLAKIEARRAEDQRQLAQGNRGYVVRNGLSTLVAAPTLGNKLQVRVLEPQTE